MIINSMEMFQITVPLLVLEQCPTPAHLSTWVAPSFWHCFRNQRLDDALIARRAALRSTYPLRRQTDDTP
jgi:hypothetical protein